MILIVTLNPLLEKRFSHSRISLGVVNRNCNLNYAAGGKGINVSRQLKNFGLNSFNFFFAGSNNGKLFREIIKKEGLEFSFIPIKDETRESAIIISEEDKQITSCFTPDPEISLNEVEELKTKLDKMIQNCEIVIFAGSSPSEAAQSIIPFGIQLANKYDKISICDTYGSNLKECLDSAPTIIHNNLNEIESSLKIKLDSENAILNFMEELNKKDVKRIYLTNGANEFYASNFNYKYKVKPIIINSIDSTGSGDCFVASITNSWINGEVFEESLKTATAAAGINSASFDVCNVSQDEISELKGNVQIFSIGKKMKLIDDSPHEI